ncbi:mitochondrial import inner membrane translocase subunit TIM17-3-like [Arachis duranensis]|uniref:Mitochondrial import inner membrane translocase subunit TIM17-3-like n=1 Tax=Arachis duranensis TaxID=130453 RepID=A0A9C6TJ04_ARADU|nr:mitochondrial import inner membrane translocase subunit TIM17-3-like [Arachis duranensis]
MYTFFKDKTPETREQCLDYVLNSGGSGFLKGVIGGSTFYFFKSLCSSPTHAATACHAVLLNAPRVGGKFAAWYALNSAVNYTLCSVRQKNDSWNRISAPAIGSGLLSLCRRSLRASAYFTMFGALIGTVREVGLITLNKFEADCRLEGLRKAVAEFEEGSTYRCNVAGRN